MSGTPLAGDPERVFVVLVSRPEKNVGVFCGSPKPTCRNLVKTETSGLWSLRDLRSETT